MRLLLVRHGQTPSNVAGLLDTDRPGPGLTPLGHRQAAAVPAALDDARVDGVAVSTLVRTTLTATPLLEQRGLEPLVLDDLREIEAGELEMAGDADAVRRYLTTVFAWGRGDLACRMPGGPDGAEFVRRYDAAVAAVADAGWEHAVVVSHGAAIRSWLTVRAAGLDVEQVARTPLPNTGLVEVEGDPVSGWRVVRWSDGPVGGTHLDAVHADDPTGEPVDEAVEHASREG